MSVQHVFGFPDPVNETSARLVAAGVIGLTIAFLVTQQGWLLVPIVYGFLARMLTGPTLSLLGLLSTRVVTPVLERFGVESRRVPGPPKRFAQGIGFAVSGGAAAAWLTGAPVVTVALLGVLLVAATLEAVFAICVGCIAHSAIWGCVGCNDIGERLRTAVLEAQRAAPTA